MLASLAVLLTLAAGPAGGLGDTAASGSPSTAPTSAVILLPFLPDGSVSMKQARGLGAQVRGAAEAGGYVKLLSTSKDDDKQAEKCQRDAKCLGALADLRGADLIAAGQVAPAKDGLKVAIVVVKPNGTEVLRRVEVTIQGNDGDARRFDRLARAALEPNALRGAIAITGDEGASVEVDGRAVGTLPLAGPIGDLVEGDHVVLVKKPGYDDYRRNVAVVHDETVDVKAVLLAARTDVDDEERASAPLRVDAIVATSIGGGLLLLGGVAGTLSLLDGLEVEKRAAAQQLVFPKDSGLLLRGQVYAWTANGLYVVGAGAVAAGVVLFLLPDANEPKLGGAVE